MRRPPWTLLIALLVAVFLAVLLLFQSLPDLETLKAELSRFRSLQAAHPWQSAVLFMLMQAVLTGANLPATAITLLAGGAIFGFTQGVILSSLGTTGGAILSFLCARYLFRSALEQRFGATLEKVNRALQNEGNYYLFAARMISVIPFWMINPVMGLTRYRLLPYWIITQIGMLPVILVYVNAGARLAELRTLEDALSPALLASLAAIGLLPLSLRLCLRWWRPTGTG